MAENSESTTKQFFRAAWATVVDIVNASISGWEWNRWLANALIIGVLVLLILTWSDPWQTTGVALLIAGAATAAGILTGFLFGIPRTGSADSQAPAEQGQPFSFRTNTNLELISDWLTKIIVGVGLVQLTILPEHLMSMGRHISDHSGNPEKLTPAVVNLIMAYFAFFAFLLGYLWTRIYLADEFTKAEREAREKPEYFEGIIHALLYQPPPLGYTEAIKRADLYLKRFGESNERVWAYKALAFGQKYSHLKRTGKSEQAPEVLEAGKEALFAAQQASALSDDARAMLFSQWDKDTGRPGEDDLRGLADEPGFKDLFKDLIKAKK